MRARLSSFLLVASAATITVVAGCLPADNTGSGGSGGAPGAGGNGGAPGTGGSAPISASCNDGIQNSKETDVDCGGTCPVCAKGKHCSSSSDCSTGVCLTGACADPSCTDGLKDGQESDTDCGGTCGPCGDGKNCKGPSDCENGVCTTFLCQTPTCKDGAQNGSETGKDCGGTCPSCPDGEGCAVATDCKSRLCEGTVCKSNVVWAERVGDVLAQSVTAVALDGDNEVVLGTFSGSLDLGAGAVLKSAGGTDIFLAKLDSTGTPIWVRSFGDAGNQAGAAIAVGPNGAIAITGAVQGTVDFGKGPLSNLDPAADAFLAVFDAAGNVQIQKRFAANLAQAGTALAVSALGEILLGGSFSGAIDLGCSPLTSAGSRDIFAAKLDALGGCLWSKRFGDASDQELLGVALTPSGNAILGGRFFGSVNFGGGPFSMQPMVRGAFAAELNPQGAHLFSTSFANTAFDQETQGVAADLSGNVFVAGRFTGTMAFGVGSPPLMSVGGSDMFIGKFDVAGNVIWSRSFGDATDQASVARLAASTSGSIVLGGSFQGGIDFGGGLLASAGSDDVFLARFDDAGNHLLSLRAGDAASQRATALAASGANTVVLGGAFQGKLTLGTAALTSAGDDDAFLTRLQIP